MPEMERLRLSIDHAQHMHYVLTLPKNAGKGHWSSMDIPTLLDLMDREVEEFKAAIWQMEAGAGTVGRVADEGADVSAFVAFIVDNLRNKAL